MPAEPSSIARLIPAGTQILDGARYQASIDAEGGSDSMKIAVDMDGVLYDFQRTYRYMLREYWDVEMPPIEEFWIKWDAQLKYGTKEQHEWMWVDGVDAGLFRYGHMITGARRGLEQLAHDYELGIVTHRPARATPDTVDWLSLYMKDIPYTLNILSNGEPKHSVKADVLIDDKGSNIEQWCRAGRVGVVFERPWSEFTYVPGSRLARDWKETVDVVRSL